MKNLLIVVCLLLLGISGCKDDDVKPKKSIQIEDIIGTWVSVDSVMGLLPDSTLNYLHDYIEFKMDSLIINEPNKFQRSGRSSYYRYYLYPVDSLNLQYIGPGEIGFVNNNWLHKIIISGDTLSILDLYDTYPYYYFNKFVKL